MDQKLCMKNQRCFSTKIGNIQNPEYRRNGEIGEIKYIWKAVRIQNVHGQRQCGKQAELGVPHSRIQVELGFILQAGTCQNPRNVCSG